MISIDWKKERVVLLCDHCGREITDAETAGIVCQSDRDGFSDMVGVYCKGDCFRHGFRRMERTFKFVGDYDFSTFLSMMRNTIRLNQRKKLGDARNRFISSICG